MDHEPTEVMLYVEAGRDADDEEVATLTRRLRDVVRQLDVDEVKLLRAGTAPEDSKVADPITLGALVVTLASSKVLTALIEAISSWAERQRGGTVTIKIDDDVLVVPHASREERRQLLASWHAKHPAGAPSDD